MNEREYDIMYGVEARHWWYVALHDLILQSIAREAHDKGGLDILDAGCGTGRLCQLMAPYGRVRGCDQSVRALAWCRERGLEDLFIADLNSVELGENRYDAITSIDVLYHQGIADDAPVLAKFYRALKPGGLLVLNLVAHEFLRSSHDIAVHTRKRYTLKGLLPLLAREGFVVEKATYRLGFLFVPIACYRFAKRRLGRNREREQVDSDTRAPMPVVNRVLLWLNLLENLLLKRWSSPLGTSLYVVARKPIAATGMAPADKFTL